MLAELITPTHDRPFWKTLNILDTQVNLHSTYFRSMNMLYDGIKLAEGSNAKNLVVHTGGSFPANPDAGELFYRIDAENVGLWAYDGFTWQKLGGANLPNIVTAGTYRSVTVNTQGLVTAGTNPTTLAGYGITDAAPISHIGTGGSSHAEATTTVAGFMSAADKTKLDNAYHTGNLSFGSGLSYSGGTLTVTGGGGDVTLVGTQTLTNKTLSGAIHTGTIDIQGSTRSIINDITNTVNCSLGNFFRASVSSNTTFSFTNAPASRAYSFILEVNHTSGTITWPTSVRWPNGTAPTLTTGRTHMFVFITDDGGTIWRGAANVDYTTA